MMRFRLTAPLVVARDQPKSCSSGSSSAPVEDRNPAAAISAPMVIAATNHARCTAVSGDGRVSTGAVTTPILGSGGGAPEPGRPTDLDIRPSLTS